MRPRRVKVVRKDYAYLTNPLPTFGHAGGTRNFCQVERTIPIDKLVQAGQGIQGMCSDKALPRCLKWKVESVSGPRAIEQDPLNKGCVSYSLIRIGIIDLYSIIAIFIAYKSILFNNTNTPVVGYGLFNPALYGYRYLSTFPLSTFSKVECISIPTFLVRRRNSACFNNFSFK